MSLPTVVKTWMYNVNNLNPTQGITGGTDDGSLLWGIKNALSGFNPNGWFVTGSCDATGSGFQATGIDRWSSSSSLIWNAAGSAHSWIVMQQSGILPNFQVCLDLNHGPGTNGQDFMSVIVSPVSGFQGGSTTARPSASDEVVLRDGGNGAQAWNGRQNANYTARWHAMQSTDGQCTRVVVYVSNAATVFFAFEKPNNPVSGWPTPWVALYDAQPAGPGAVMTYANLLGAPSSTWCLRGRSNIAFSGSLSTEGTNAQALGQAFALPNEIDGQWPMTPVGVVTTQAGIRGRHCTLFDMWFGSTQVQDGMNYPDNQTRAFAQFGTLIFPWNGTKALTA